MGIFGLTTYISEHSSEFLKDHKLHNCSILIDGNAAASIIYGHYTKCIHAFGGDYDKFAHCVIEFIELLRKCNVVPCFIFDGGYEKRKLKTVIERIKLNIAICSQFKKKFKESKCFPLLMRDVFKDVLRSINVTVIQCDFEADQELVVLARILNCPVISNDSDFYISNITYIPFSSLDFKTYKLNKEKDKFYMKCKVYNVNDLLNKFGGLSDKSLLPLMSCALGNDYIPPHTFKNFLGITHSSKLAARMEKIVEWLRGVIFADAAIEQLIACAPKKSRRGFRYMVKQFLNDCNSKSSQLIEHIPESFHISCELADIMNNLNISKNIEECDQNESIAEFEISSVTEKELLIGVGDDTFSVDDNIEILDSCEYEIEDVNEAENTVDSFNLDCSNLNETRSMDGLPEWIKQKFRLGLLSPTVVNMYNFKRIFIPSQSEDYLSPPSHMIIFPIMKVVIAIVLGNNAIEVKCHARLRSTITGIYKLAPQLSTNFLSEVPSLETIESIDCGTRRAILLKCLNINDNVNLKWFPEEWKIFIIAVLYWLSNCNTTNLNQNHIRSMILCLIHLSVIDKKIGYTRSQQELNRLSNLEKKKSNEAKEPSNLKESRYFDDLPEINDDQQIIDIICQKDCIIAASALLHYHFLDNNLSQNRKSFDTKLVHGFAQLQHCLQAVTLLNSVLDFPYQPCMFHQVFSGTFLYNFYTDMTRRKLADGYIIRTLLSKASSIISLYKYLMRTLTQVLPTLKETGSSNAAKKKKKSRRKTDRVPVPTIQVEEKKEEFIDAENLYSLLTVIDC